MSRYWVKNILSKLAKVREGETKEVSHQRDGEQLLFRIIDRKVFDVEDSSVTEEEFMELTEWSVGEYNKSDINRLSGRLVSKDPEIYIEVVRDEPVFIEIHDYEVRYRVNIYHATQEVDIRVLEPIKEKELQFGGISQPISL